MKVTRQKLNKQRKERPPNLRSKARISKSLQNPNKQVAVATAYASGTSSFVPDIKSSSYGSTRIRHRELVAGITGSSAFTINQSLALNPGISQTFPWLSTQAIGWEQYHFKSLRFCYYTRCSTLTAGSVMISPDYDAADISPASEQIMSSYANCIEDAPWKDIVCRLDEKSMHPDGSRKFVRTGPLISPLVGQALDIKTYDVGNLFVATLDGGSTNWGKLWIEYDVIFYVPQLAPTGAGDLYQSLITPTSTTNGVSSTNLLGNLPTAGQGSTGYVTWNPSVSGTSVTFAQGGTFLMTFYFASNTTTGVINVTSASSLTGQGPSSFNKLMFVPAGNQIIAAGNYESQMTASVNVVQGTIFNFPAYAVSGTFTFLISELIVIPLPPDAQT